MESDRQKEGLRKSNLEANKLTKEAIQIALVSLMADKDFKDITITEIVKKAGVSRTAFYRNYKIKEDVVLEFYGNMLSSLLKMAFSEKYKNNWYSFFLDSFKKAREEERNVKILMKANLLNFNSLNLDKIIDDAFNPNSKEARYKILAINSSIYSIIYEWLNSGMKESDEFMAELCTKIVKGII